MRHSKTLLETLDTLMSYRIEPREARVPVTIAWGANDRVLIGPQDQRAKRALPQATHLLLPDFGHLFFADDAELIASIIDKTASAATSPGNAKSAAR
jgi:pimeloyl-ACP methyl ester carboxylesterase